jgi:hypothetical protein
MPGEHPEHSKQQRNNINMEAYQAYYNTNEAKALPGQQEAQFATQSPQTMSSPTKATTSTKTLGIGVAKVPAEPADAA